MGSEQPDEWRCAAKFIQGFRKWYGDGGLRRQLDDRAGEQFEPAGDRSAIPDNNRFELNPEKRIRSERRYKEDRCGQDQSRLWPLARSPWDGTNRGDSLCDQPARQYAASTLGRSGFTHFTSPR